MASESWSSGTMISIGVVGLVDEHAADLRRARARCTRSGPESSSQGTMSIFSPRSSCTTACTRLPFMPTQAPTGSTSRVAAGDGDLRAAARLAGRGLDDHDALGDLRDLHLEQLDEQVDRGAGEDDLRALATRGARRARRPGRGRPARYVSRGICSRTGQHRLGAAEVDDDVAALEAPGDAGDDLVLAVLVLVVDVLALGVAGALDDDLLGGLRGDAAEAAAEGLQPEDVAVLLVLGLGLVGVLVAVEDLEEQLVAGLGLDALLARGSSSEIWFTASSGFPTSVSTTVRVWNTSTTPLSSL